MLRPRYPRTGRGLPTILINAINLYLILSMIATIFWTARVRTLNGSAYTFAAFLLCLAMCFYIFGYAFELNSTTASQVAFWNKFEYIGIPFIAALWLTTTLLYTGRFLRYKKILFAAIFLVPAITVALRFTNSYHHLYFLSITYTHTYGTMFLIKSMGPWMYVQSAHSLLMIVLAMALFIYDAAKNGERHNCKTILIIVASLSAIAGLILDAVKPFDLPIDYMPLFLPAVSMVIVIAVARYDLLETRFIARSKVFETDDDALLLINRHDKILDYNSSARTMFSQAHIHIENGYLTTLFESNPELLAALRRPEPSVVKFDTEHGERYYAITTRDIDNDKITHGLIKELRDITEVYRLNKELEKQAMTDELSSLGNRRAFIVAGRNRVLHWTHEEGPLYLLMLDFDHFKSVNDRYGHPAGDMVINSFGQMLREHFSDTALTARLGGEEFAVLSTFADDREMHASIESFLDKFRKRVFSYHEERFSVTVSAGITRMEPGQALENMLKLADEALYEAKEQGRDCYIVK